MLKKLRDYFFYCGIEKEAYNGIKKDAYVSNFEAWKTLHFLLAAIFAGLYAVSWFDALAAPNQALYLAGLLYSAAAILLFCRLKKDSLAGQLLIYLTMSLLFLFGGFLSKNSPNTGAINFIVLLLIVPMFMIDKPFFMAFELGAAGAIFLVWMHGVKPYDVWLHDLYNVVIYGVIGVFLNVIANSVRAREFVLARKIMQQRDTDEMTGIRNKAALTREINAYLADKANIKGAFFILDVDRFKSINDTYGHDAGDRVIVQLGKYLDTRFHHRYEIAGRFGGDEFIVFVMHNNDPDAARQTAAKLAEGVAQSVTLPDRAKKVSVSVGIALYRGQEKNYSELLKKADIALYQAKADPDVRYRVYGEE